MTRFSLDWRAIERSPCRCVTRVETCRRLPSKPPTHDDSAVGELQVPLIRSGAGAPFEVVQARLEVTQPLTPLRTLLRSADSWFLLTAAGTGMTALLLAVWVSSRISRPLAALAEKTAVLDLDRLDVDFDPGTDEVGRLSRLLGDLAARLRTSTARVREAERRATVGELARQINHDIKNGLIPLRNVLRHLGQVERDEPGALPVVFAERRQTVDSSIAYLETLATSYQRLSPPPDRRDCDLNALIVEVVRGAQGHEHVEFVTDLASLPPVRRRSGGVPAYPREPDRQRGGQPAVEAGSHHGVDAGGQSRRRAAGGPGDGRRYGPRNVR